MYLVVESARALVLLVWTDKLAGSVDLEELPLLLLNKPILKGGLKLLGLRKSRDCVDKVVVKSRREERGAKRISRSHLPFWAPRGGSRLLGRDHLRRVPFRSDGSVLTNKSPAGTHDNLLP